MYLIVGLGNPGKTYENTRHNVGFFFLDAYVKQKGFESSSWKEKNRGMYLETTIQNEKVIFLKPLSFMNLSGEVVETYQKYYGIQTEDILIVCDDLDLSLGTIKLKEKGSCGGHNGLRNIELHLRTQNYKRIKVGISNNKEMDTANYVLSKFSKEEQEIMTKLQPKMIEILDFYFEKPFSILMSQYSEKNR